MSSPLHSAVLALAASAVLIGFGLAKKPGMGMLITIAFAGGSFLSRGFSPEAFGLVPPANWSLTIVLGVVLGTLMQLVATVLIEPVCRRITGEKPDLSVLDAVKGNPQAFVKWLLIIWLIVAPVEEALYRGLLMSEMQTALGPLPWATGVSVLGSSVVFGFSHSYQGKAGILATGAIGLMLGVGFALSSGSILMVVITHGVFDTVALGLLASGWDERLRRLVFPDAGPIIS